jgi:hypothetical protein
MITQSIQVRGAGTHPAPGQFAFHDRHYDGRIRSLEVEAPTAFGTALAEPLAANPSRGYWVIAIKPR